MPPAACVPYSRTMPTTAPAAPAVGARPSPGTISTYAAPSINPAATALAHPNQDTGSRPRSTTGTAPSPPHSAASAEYVSTASVGCLIVLPARRGTPRRVAAETRPVAGGPVYSPQGRCVTVRSLAATPWLVTFD